MPTISESNVYALWAATQSALRPGSYPASTSARRLTQVGGDFDLQREDGSENYSDLDRFGATTDFISTVRGNGAPVLQAKADDVGYLCFLFFGAGTFTAKVAGTSPPKFVYTPGTNTGQWSTWWKRVGLNDVTRQEFRDCKITSLKIEGSTANKVVKVTPTVTSLTPGLTYSTDPTGSISTQPPFLYTEAVGSFTVDGTVFKGQTQFSVTIDDGQQPIQGDSTTFYDLVAGNATISMEGPTLVLDSDSRAIYNNIIYGSASPAAGAAPRTDRPYVGSYSVEFSRGTGDAKQSLKIELPGVKWNPDLAIAPNPDGGAIELPLNGQMRKVTGSPAVRVTVETGTGQSTQYT